MSVGSWIHGIHVNCGCCSGALGLVLGSEQPKAAAHKILCENVVNQTCLGFGTETVLATGNGYKGKFMQISSDMELIEPHR